MTPHAATAERLVKNALAGALPAIDGAEAALAERARALVGARSRRRVVSESAGISFDEAVVAGPTRRS